MHNLKIILITLFTLFFTPLYALTVEEATRYGSRIIVCYNNKGEEIYLRYWKLIVKHQTGGERNRNRANAMQEGRTDKNLKEHIIFDMQKKRNYSLDACKLYYCSPRPDRMRGCIMPEDKKRTLDIRK